MKLLGRRRERRVRLYNLHELSARQDSNRRFWWAILALLLVSSTFNATGTWYTKTSSTENDDRIEGVVARLEQLIVDGKAQQCSTSNNSRGEIREAFDLVGAVLRDIGAGEIADRIHQDLAEGLPERKCPSVEDR